MTFTFVLKDSCRFGKFFVKLIEGVSWTLYSSKVWEELHFLHDQKEKKDKKATLQIFKTLPRRLYPKSEFFCLRTITLSPWLCRGRDAPREVCYFSCQAGI